MFVEGGWWFQGGKLLFARGDGGSRVLSYCLLRGDGGSRVLSYCLLRGDGGSRVLSYCLLRGDGGSRVLSYCLLRVDGGSRVLSYFVDMFPNTTHSDFVFHSSSHHPKEQCDRAVVTL